MVHASLRMLIPPKKWEEVASFLLAFSRRTSVEPGCLCSRVYQDLEQKRGILLEELWKDEEQLDRHLRSPEFQKVILMLELSVAVPEISFKTISRSTGIETIEKARNVPRAEEGPDLTPSV